MDKLKRGIHIDFHTMPGIYDFNRDFDAKEFAKRLSDAHVTIINMFAQCNLGFSYYPTKAGVPYPSMKGDMFGSILKECHEKNIRVVAYMSICLNHDASRRNYNWCKVDAEGRIIRNDRTANFFRTNCLNSSYHDYIFETIKEVCAYDIDGLFLDNMLRDACYCNKCCEDMVAQGIDITDAGAVAGFAYKVLRNAAEEVRAILPEGKLLYLNGFNYDEVDDLEYHIEVECLPSGGWGYDYFIPRASYARNLQKDVLYMTGRFQASWGDFGGLKSKASIEHDVYDALCQGVQYSIGDHMHPAENLEKDMYEMIGGIYGRTMLYEKYTDDAKYQSDIGIIINKQTYGGNQPGIARMLSEAKYSFEIIHEWMDIDKFKLIILPDHTFVDENLAKKLKAYVGNGGKIFSSGSSGTNANGFIMNEWSDFIDYEGADGSTCSYYKTYKQIDEADMKYAMYNQAILMTAKDKTDSRAEYIKPYFNRRWDGFHGFYYTPPEKLTGQTAVAISKDKTIAHVCFNIFEAYYAKASVFHKNLVKMIIEEMMPNQLIKAPTMPSTSRVTLTGTDKYKLLHVKVTFPEPRGGFDIIEEHVVLSAGRKVYVRGEYRTAKLLPCETPVESVVENGYTIVTLPEITGYDMFLLQ